LLTIYRGNRAEHLAQLLAAQLRLTPPPPLQTVRVVVNTWPTSRWLGEQLATHLGGVVANVRFPFPASTLRQLVDLVLDETAESQQAPGALHSAGQDPWRADQLVWAVLEQWPTLASDAVAAPLNRWLGERDLGQRLDLASWQLARSIADAFDDYALYRPEMLQAWDQGQDVDGRRRPLGASQSWQPHLYRLLRRKLARQPFGLRALAAMERLRQPPSAALRERLAPFAGGLRLFGLSSLAPVQVQLLQALSAVLPVDLFLLTPCQDLWQRCVDRRQQLTDALALKEPLDLDWLLQAPGLEARFGRLGAEFQQLLEGTGEALLARQRELDLFFLPVTAGARGDAAPAAAPLLLQLQQQLADAANPCPLVRSSQDTSLEFHGCPGPLRQVQIVRDRLLQLLAADPSLEPRDILVMTPNVDGFAPLLASVFGDREATGVELPWRLTDRSQQSEAGIARTLLGLLRVAGDRFTATALEGLLEAQPLRERFGLTAPEVTEFNHLLQRSGFRWGLDGNERGGDPTHSLAWVIDRLLLALVLPETPGLAPGGVAPAASGADLERTGRWLHLLTRLRHWLGQLRQPGSSAVWAVRLQELLLDLFGDGGAAAWELALLHAAINNWQEAAGQANPLVLEAAVVAALLDEQLAIDSGRFGHRSGTLTISALEPMRAIPHRVIVLMGLDADLFPRQRNRPAFHLMEQQRLLGDPHPADQDRYVLMEALLSARDHLLITWSCRDERKGEERPPSAPVRQWLQWLQEQLGAQAAGLEVVHAASPLDRRNFLPHGDLPPASCDRRLLAARQLLEQHLPPSQPWASGPMPETSPQPAAATERRAQRPPSPAPSLQEGPQEHFEALRQWLMAPQKNWLRELGLRPGEWARPIEDLEPLTLPERARVALLREGLVATGPMAGPGASGDWLLWCRGTGQLPPQGGGELEARTLQRRWQTLQDAKAALGPPSCEPLSWGDWQAAPQWQGDSVVVCHPAKASTAQFVDLWLQLVLAAACATSPRQGVLIARDSPDGFAAALTLNPLDAEAARQELERLAALARRGRQVCWPVPPDSGWAWVSQEQAKAGSGDAQAAEAWEGHVRRRGERLREEMVVCFGADLPASSLIDGDFGPLATELYGPILAAMVKPKERSTLKP
jgi:exodeoxyribonuclease V gamma subunit